MPKRLFFFSLTNLPFILRKYFHFLFPAYELKAKQPKYRKRKKTASSSREEAPAINQNRRSNKPFDLTNVYQ